MAGRVFLKTFFLALFGFAAANAASFFVRSDREPLSHGADTIQAIGFPFLVWMEGGLQGMYYLDPTAVLWNTAAGLGASLIAASMLALRSRRRTAKGNIRSGPGPISGFRPQGSSVSHALLVTTLAAAVMAFGVLALALELGHILIGVAASVIGAAVLALHSGSRAPGGSVASGAEATSSFRPLQFSLRQALALMTLVAAVLGIGRASGDMGRFIVSAICTFGPIALVSVAYRAQGIVPIQRISLLLVLALVLAGLTIAIGTGSLSLDQILVALFVYWTCEFFVIWLVQATYPVVVDVLTFRPPPEEP